MTTHHSNNMWKTLRTFNVPNVIRRNHMDVTKSATRRQNQLSKARIDNVAQLSPTIKLLSVHIEDEQFMFTPGQWVDFHIPGESVVGGYSICSTPAMLRSCKRIQLAVKYSSHPPAHWVHTQCRVGDEVLLRAGGDFLCASGVENVLFIAGGIGINPLLSMMTSMSTSRAMKLLYSAISLDELVFKDDIDALCRLNSTIKVLYFVTRQQLKNNGCDVIKNRRINTADIFQTLSEFKANVDVIVLLCGPREMMIGLRSMLVECGVEKTNIRFEAWW